jgi:acetyl-CoA acetyltransferase
MDAIIAGIGHTEFSKNSGRSPLHLAVEAARDAIADAGLTPADIDGSVTFQIDQNDELAVIRNLGIPQLRFSSRTRGGGGGACATVQHAAAAVVSGQARAVLIWRAFNERSRRRFGQPNRRPPDAAWDFYLPFGLDTPAKIYGLAFQRYMYSYGLTNADFGLYSVVARQYAATNPNAWFYKRPITLEDHQASRWIVEPLLRLLDCCQESDGGVALVVTRADRAEDLPNPAARIAAASAANVQGGDEMFNYYHADLTSFVEGEALARDLWAQSGYGPWDMDVAMIYENFSPIVFLQLEAFGYCEPGQARDFIADGAIGPGGRIPVNTNGGLLGEGYIHGMNNIIEAVRQLRGTAPNQVASAERVLITAGRSGLILDRELDQASRSIHQSPKERSHA